MITALLFIFRRPEIEMWEDRKYCNVIGCSNPRTAKETTSVRALFTSVYFVWFDWIEIVAVDLVNIDEIFIISPEGRTFDSLQRSTPSRTCQWEIKVN